MTTQPAIPIHITSEPQIEPERIVCSQCGGELADWCQGRSGLQWRACMNSLCGYRIARLGGQA